MINSNISEKLLVQHNNLANQYRNGLKHLKDAGELLDVTLVTDDDMVEVHKVVMSASSPLFRKILHKSSTQSQPYIYLRGVKSEFLKTIIDFVYDGEVFISSENLDTFLEVAQDLQINGLSVDDLESTNIAMEDSAVNDEDSLQSDPRIFDPSTSASNENEKQNEHDEIEEVAISSKKVEKEVPISKNEAGVEVNLNMDGRTLKELRAEVYSNVIVKENSNGWKVFSCKICAKIFKRRDKLNAHIETHLEKFSFTCEICDKSLCNRRSLRHHINYNHKSA